MKTTVLLAISVCLIFSRPAIAKQNISHKKAQADLESMDDNSKVSQKIEKDAQHELELTETALEEADAKVSALAAKQVNLNSKSKVIPKKISVVSKDLGPQLLVAPVKDEVNMSEEEPPTVKVQESNVSPSQANIDYQNARETLKEVKKEWQAKKNHVKTKDEIRREKEEVEYRFAITKALKEHHGKSEKTQVVHTHKGNFKVVFVDESEFTDGRPAIVSPELRQAIKDRDREPASVDDQIDSATQN